jgi:hypothetical protein
MATRLLRKTKRGDGYALLRKTKRGDGYALLRKKKKGGALNDGVSVWRPL